MSLIEIYKKKNYREKERIDNKLLLLVDFTDWMNIKLRIITKTFNCYSVQIKYELEERD